jgi:hypothetical protein
MASSKKLVKWKEPHAFRHARAVYEISGPKSLRKQLVTMFGAFGAIAAIGFHFMNELIRNAELGIALLTLAFIAGILYLPLRGWLLANVDAEVSISKGGIERVAAFGLERDKWNLEALRTYRFVPGKDCELLFVKMADGKEVPFGVPHDKLGDVASQISVLVKPADPGQILS